MSFVWGIICGFFWGKKGSRFKSRQELEAWQTKQKKRHAWFLQKHSPYYRALLPPSSDLVLDDLPTMNKSTLMKHFDDINTQRLQKAKTLDIATKAEETRDFSPTINRITVGLSSGTSGLRGIFAVSKFEQGFWSGYILRRMLPPKSSRKGKTKIALFLRSGSNLYSSTRTIGIQFKYFDLKQEWDFLIQELNSFKPTIIAAPPSVLKRLSFTTLSFSPTKIISVADVLDEQEQITLEQAFRQPIFQIYQATEGLIALSCDQNRMHLNEDLIFFDLMPLSDNRFTPIISDFRRMTIPIVRYQLNDILHLSNDLCPCGSPMKVLKKVEGRMDQILYGQRSIRKSDEEGLTPIFPDFFRNALSAALESIDGARDYTVIQKTIDHLEIGIDSQLPLQEYEQRLIAEAVAHVFEQFHCKAPHITFVNYTQPSLDQKMLRIRRSYETDNTSNYRFDQA